MKERMITVQRIALRVKERGEGHPVLFVHGTPNSADMWDEVIGHNLL
ncbi:MAG TPA: hypothetical protein PLD47_02220 [Aggregatilineales bacterium]|mgnify:CR=1 FL=1|nr:hypothetical protein [Anaerolineales bacterium]HRE46514.1 hypothetical protein [Aggregatilineales bacterium]